MNCFQFQDIRFECQQSGHCCSDPGILVTLTFHDIYNLYQALDNDFEYLIKKLTFFRLDADLDDEIRERLVLEAVHTVEGEVIPGLKKINGHNCTFYSYPNCTIYQNRPRACRNYPFTFYKKQNQTEFIWAKDAEKNCPGIGKGPSINVDKLLNSGHKTLTEIKSHNELIDQLNIEADKGNPLTAREAIWMFIVYGEKISSN